MTLRDRLRYRRRITWRDWAVVLGVAAGSTAIFWALLTYPVPVMVAAWAGCFALALRGTRGRRVGRCGR